MTIIFIIRKQNKSEKGDIARVRTKDLRGRDQTSDHYAAARAYNRLVVLYSLFLNEGIPGNFNATRNWPDLCEYRVAPPAMALPYRG